MTNLQPGVLEEPPATELFLIPDEVSAEMMRNRDPMKWDILIEQRIPKEI